jgi:hypothetical protein
MKRFWISWYSKLEPDNIPFKCWITGETMDEPPAYTYCSLMDAESEEDAFDKVFQLFPDYTYRFCEEKPSDWQLGDRFQ